MDLNTSPSLLPSSSLPFSVDGVVRDNGVNKAGLTLLQRLNDAGVQLDNKDDVSALLSMIDGKLLLKDWRIYNLVTHRFIEREKKVHFKQLHHGVIAPAFAAAMLTPSLIKTVSKSPRSPLRGFNELQVRALMGAYLYDKLADKVFTAKNLEPWGVNLRMSREILIFLKECNFVTTLDKNQVAYYTEKIVIPVKRPPLYYMLTPQGHTAINTFFKLFAEEFERMTETAWDIEGLKKLDPEIKLRKPRKPIQDI